MFRPIEHTHHTHFTRIVLRSLSGMECDGAQAQFRGFEGGKAMRKMLATEQSATNRKKVQHGTQHSPTTDAEGERGERGRDGRKKEGQEPEPQHDNSKRKEIGGGKETGGMGGKTCTRRGEGGRNVREGRERGWRRRGHRPHLL